MRGLKVFILTVFASVSMMGSDLVAADFGTISLEKIPDGATIEVVDFDNSELSSQLVAQFTKRLSERGFVVQEDADFLFRFATDMKEPKKDKSKPRVAFEGEAGAHTDLEGEVRVNLGKGEGRNAAKVDRALKLRVSIAQQNRPPLWTGYASDSLLGTDRLKLGAALADQLMDYVGTTSGSGDDGTPPEQ